MDVLEKLHTAVAKLLERLEILKKENLRLQTEISILADEKTRLQEERQALLLSLEKEEGRRAEALDRLEILICRIREQNSLE